MSFTTSIYDDCCLLTHINLNSERIDHLLERRFKSNSTETSFDFKSFLPEQPSNKTKVSRSLLRCQPKTTYVNNYEENTSSGRSSASEEDDDHDEVFSPEDDDDDDRLNQLAEWEPGDFQPIVETDDDGDEDIPQSVSPENHDKEPLITPMDLSSVEESPVNPVEDLLVTFIHRPLKSEPVNDQTNSVFDNPPQLDGQMDVPSTKSDSNDTQKRLDDAIAKVRAKKSAPSKTIQLHHIPPCRTKCRLNDEVKKKSTILTPKKSSSKIDRPKESKRKELKAMKKVTPRLLSSVMKTNEDAIRALQTSCPTNIQKPLRSPSDSRLQTSISRPQIQRKSLSKDERTIIQTQRRSSLIDSKDKRQQQNVKSSVKCKEKSASDHMTLAEKKLNHFQKHQQSKPTSAISSSTKSKPKENLRIPPSLPKPKTSLAQKTESASKLPLSNEHKQAVPKKAKKLKSLNIDQPQTKTKTQKPIEDCTSNKQPLTNPQSESSIIPTNDNTTTKKRPVDFFVGCITIDDDDDQEDMNTGEDDDDIQEIERQHYPIAHNIRSREKLLDHIVHSSAMHIKWLFNLDCVLLEHISICHENNIRPSYSTSLSIKSEFLPSSSTYQIDPSFISILIINFLKLFILRNSSNDQQNVSFIQFGLTSHLRYLLIELPTSNHPEEKDLADLCSKCRQYSLIINILFDLLFDLIESDLCEITSKTKYRSSLIEDDYFTRFAQTKTLQKDPFYRIKLLIYLIELIGMHMRKCSNKKQFQFNKNENKLFQAMEDFLRHILSHLNNSINQRISICFNVMELCLLFVNEKEIRIKQMALYLAELSENNSENMKLFLFEKNLFPDVRLWLINELISRKLNKTWNSLDQIRQFFDQIQADFNSRNSIDESVLLLLRSLFQTYADLILEIKAIPWMYLTFFRELKPFLHEQLELILTKLIEISLQDPQYFQKIKSTLFFYRLLKFRCTFRSAGVVVIFWDLFVNECKQYPKKNMENNEQVEESIANDVAQVLNDLLTHVERQFSPSQSTEFTSFVVEDIVHQIRLTTSAQQQSSSTDDISSPSLSSSIVDVPSAQSSRSISPSQLLADPNHVLLPVDKRILEDIESYSRDVAQEFVTTVEQLTTSLHNMSATSVCCLQTYRDVVGEKLNDTIETNIKTVYSFIAQAEKLSAQLGPIYELQKKITYIKQLLDILSQSI